jgi:hypothetical protein
MINLTVTADNDLLQQLAYRLPSVFGEKVAPATKAAFNTSARYIQGVWKGWAMGSPIAGIPDIRKPNGKLANSIKIKKNGPFDVEIYSESPHMKRIVEGTDPYDMKEDYPYGRKSRVSKKGIPYLIIPFRWATPNQKGGKRAHFSNVIPTSLFKEVKAFTMSEKKIAEDGKAVTHNESNYSGNDVERSDYNWGDRLTDVGGDEEGMVRMRNDTGGSTYFTFRVISAISPASSWIRKASPPVDIEGGLERAVRPYVETLVEAGLKADIGI